jgi:hypothetical protein
MLRVIEKQQNMRMTEDHLQKNGERLKNVMVSGLPQK